MAHLESGRPESARPDSCVGHRERRSAMIVYVGLPLAELSSLASALEDLTNRISEIAKHAADDQNESATELFSAERALKGAQRRIAKLATPPRGRSSSPSRATGDRARR